MAIAARYCLFDTAYAACGIAWRDGAVARLQLPEADSQATESRLRRFTGDRQKSAPPAVIADLIVRLQDYFAGTPAEFGEVAADLGGGASPYRAIYRAVQALHWGETASYGEIARRVGAPATAQMVGQAMARNPVPIIVPCHRVLAAGHALGGFSAYGGIALKERLLMMEGVCVDPAPRLPGL